MEEQDGTDTPSWRKGKSTVSTRTYIWVLVVAGILLLIFAANPDQLILTQAACTTILVLIGLVLATCGATMLAVTLLREAPADSIGAKTGLLAIFVGLVMATHHWASVIALAALIICSAFTSRRSEL